MTRSKPDPFTVACPLPRCAAAPGHLCRDQRTGEPAKHPHLDRIVAARGPSEKEELRRALVRLCWYLIADGAECTCCLDDVCPACEAYRALGYGRRWSVGRVETMLAGEKRS